LYKSDIDMRTLVKSIKALSDGTRIRILKVLCERDCCVCEVRQALDISQSRASRNLNILESAGFVSSSRDGLWIVYSINKQSDNCIDSLLELLNTNIEEEQTVILDKERLAEVNRAGCKC
jgi:ArsR family transcriptional regulator